nr:hypothetical protein [Fredinandcohnia onubensis]
MNKEKRSAVITAATEVSQNNSNSSPGNFEYKPPNNSGTILGIIGGVLSATGDALATIGAIIQLNTDTSVDFQSQVHDYHSEQDKKKMQEEIDNLQEKVKQLEELIKNNQNQNQNQNQRKKRKRDQT